MKFRSIVCICIIIALAGWVGTTYAANGTSPLVKAYHKLRSALSSGNRTQVMACMTQSSAAKIKSMSEQDFRSMCKFMKRVMPSSVSQYEEVIQGNTGYLKRSVTSKSQYGSDSYESSFAFKKENGIWKSASHP